MSRRYHVAECRTLQRMRDEGRFERYVVTNRTDGMFLVDWRDYQTDGRGEVEAGLKVCKDCLSALNWLGYSAPQDRHLAPDGRRLTKAGIWSEFDITQFLFEHSTFFNTKPSRRDTDAVPNVYVSSWSKISEETRHARGWKCEECGVNLERYPALLHCHHISGVVTDNSSSNLKVLCQIDHARQPGHSHMKAPAWARLAIERLRREQNLGGVNLNNSA